MKRKLFITIILLFLVFITALYAKPIISFYTYLYDFEDIKEEDGVVEYEFIFTNKGDEPLKLIHVKAS